MQISLCGLDLKLDYSITIYKNFVTKLHHSQKFKNKMDLAMKKKGIVFCIISVSLFIQLTVQAEAGVSDIKKRLEQDNAASVETEVPSGSTDSSTIDPYDFDVEIYFDDIMYNQTTDTENVVLRKAQAGDAKSQFLMGHWLSYTKSKNESVEWFNKAAKQKYADALLALANLYKEGDIVPKDLARADEYSQIGIEWLTQAATKGDVDSQRRLGAFFESHSKTVTDDEPNFENAAKWYEKAAEKGDPLAKIELGQLYLFGRGVTQDVKRAEDYFTQVDAKRLPHTTDSISSGILFSRECPGDGSGPLSEWINVQAEKGHSWGQYVLGEAYKSNLCAPKDEGKAFEWTLKAAEQGNPDAQLTVGYALRNGTGVKVDMLEAYKWFEKAARQGNLRGKRAMQKMCEERPWACQ